MAELGLAMGQDGVSGLEEMHYALGPDGQYQPVLPPNAHQPEMGNQDQPFPHGHGAQTGGQTFASTLLLSFSCSPLLKQHLLRTLHMTNEELCSLEPILSAAWDQWDHAVSVSHLTSRRLHYAEQAAKANADQQNGSGQNTAPPSHPFGPPPNGDPNVQDPNDFRARFHRPGDRILAQVVQAAKAAAAAAAADADAEGGMDTDADISDKEDTDVSNVGENKAAS
ncbi:hypothetical protein DFH11DRAFT_1824987 [Phellopilus nigrolimitatus]|nr:hypothetical protein DFH11DRAFT_1824987 [Phellopilus nigrolimitatus]